MVQVIGELGQVPRPFHYLPPYQDRQHQLGIAVFPGVQVQHPGDGCPLQLGPVAGHGIEPAAGQLDPPLKVDNPQFLGQIPMGFGRKLRGMGFAPLPYNYVRFLAQSRRYVGTGQVWQLHQDGMDALFQGMGFLFQGVDLLADLPHFLDDRRRSVLTGGAQLPDFPAYLVAPGAQFIPPAAGLPALGVQLQQLLQGLILSPGSQRLADEFRVSSYQFN